MEDLHVRTMLFDREEDGAQGSLEGGLEGSLEGRWVRLRPLVVADAALTLLWRRSARARYLHAGASTVEQQQAWIAARPALALCLEYNFMIERRDGRPLGMLALCGIDRIHRHAEPGRFLIGDEARAKGIPAAVEAMLLLYRLAFDTLRLARVFGTVAERNHPMIKWQKYLGMQQEGRQRKHLFLDGEFQDAICFGLLEEEYRAKTLPRLQALLALSTDTTMKATFATRQSAGQQHG